MLIEYVEHSPILNFHVCYSQFTSSVTPTMKMAQIIGSRISSHETIEDSHIPI